MQHTLAYVEQRLAFMQGDWLDPSLDGKTRRSLSIVLVGIYLEYRKGQLLNKKGVQKLLRAEHVSTSARYIRIAKGLGMVTDHVDIKDHRCIVVFPTAKLVETVEANL